MSLHFLILSLIINLCHKQITKMKPVCHGPQQALAFSSWSCTSALLEEVSCFLGQSLSFLLMLHSMGSEYHIDNRTAVMFYLYCVSLQFSCPSERGTTSVMENTCCLFKNPCLVFDRKYLVVNEKTSHPCYLLP